MIKKEVLFLILFLIQVILVKAVTLNCPQSVEVDSQFSITVSHTGAEEVALYDYSTSSWDWKSGEIYTFTVTAPSKSQLMEFYGDAKVNGNLVCGSSPCLCQIEIKAHNYPTTININAPESAGINQPFTISVEAYDENGISKIEIRKGSADILKSQQCDSDQKQCSASVTVSESNSGEYEYIIKAWDGLDNSQESSTTVTITNQPPEIGKLEPLSVNKGEDYIGYVEVYDPKGDEFDVSLLSAPSGVSITPDHCSGSFYITVI